MTISLQRSFFESNQSHLRTIASSPAVQCLSPSNSVRKAGLILNHSKYDLLVWFGSKLPQNKADWVVIPSRANADIPLFFTGEIHGHWLGHDSRTAQIYEFYAD
jgi:hypothetical protein